MVYYLVWMKKVSLTLDRIKLNAGDNLSSEQAVVDQSYNYGIPVDTKHTRKTKPKPDAAVVRYWSTGWERVKNRPRWV